MSQDVNKRACLKRAKTFLASGDDRVLRYAALELRMCVEAVTYEKLGAYSNRLPLAIFSKWQPPKAVAALCELEDDAVEEYSGAVGPPGGPLTTIGQHRTFSRPWLDKNYHKVGRLLHVPTQADRSDSFTRDAPKMRLYLEAVAAECERVVQSTLTMTMAMTVEFKCASCEIMTSANATAVERTKRATCVQCGAEHVASVDGDTMRFRPSGEGLKCACGEYVWVPTKALSPGHVFACDACGLRYKVLSQVWRCVPEIREEPEPAVAGRLP